MSRYLIIYLIYFRYDPDLLPNKKMKYLVMNKELLLEFIVANKRVNNVPKIGRIPKSLSYQN